MQKAERNSFIVFPIIVLTGILIALAGSYAGSTIGGIPIFACCVVIIFVIQWVAFIPAYLLQTEKFFDLTGSLTYIATISIAALLSPALGTRSLLLWGIVVIWAARLGTFLFQRIRKAGKDDRFDDLKTSFIRFLNVWTIQALWVTLTMAAALAAITSTNRKGPDVFMIIGFLLWIFGFAIEVIADAQKSRFNADPQNKGKFIQSGLWARSRHPNYFGEIVLWIGAAIIAFPALQGWQLFTLISPIFVALLLTRVSGIPLLEKKADQKWGGQAEYEDYKKKTPVLIPRL